MSLSTATVAYDVSALLGTDYQARSVSGWITTNISNDTLIDADAGLIRLGNDNLPIGADGTGTVTLWTPGADGNPTTWQYTFHIAYYPLGGDGERQVRPFGPYTITEDANLATLEAEQAAPPEFQSEFMARVEALFATYTVGVGPQDKLDTFIEGLPAGTEYVWDLTDGAGGLLDIVSGVA